MKKLVRRVLYLAIKELSNLVSPMKGTTMFKQLASLISTALITMGLLSGCGSSTSNQSGLAATCYTQIDTQTGGYDLYITGSNTGDAISGEVGSYPISFTYSGTYYQIPAAYATLGSTVTFTDSTLGTSGTCSVASTSTTGCTTVNGIYTCSGTGTVCASGYTYSGTSCIYTGVATSGEPIGYCVSGTNVNGLCEGATTGTGLCATGYTYVAGVGCELLSGTTGTGVCASGYVYENGTCVYTGTTGIGVCATGYTNVNGTCVLGSTGTGVCATGYVYENGTCVYTGTTTGTGVCATGYVYENGTCVYTGTTGTGVCSAGYIYENGTCVYTGGTTSAMACSLIPLSPSTPVYPGTAAGFEIQSTTGVELEIVSISDGEQVYTSLPYVLTSGNTFGVTWGSAGTFTLSIVAQSVTGIPCNGGAAMSLTVDVY